MAKHSCNVAELELGPQGAYSVDMLVPKSNENYRFQISRMSESNNATSVYVVVERKGSGWACSCPGWKFQKDRVVGFECKHISACKKQVERDTLLKGAGVLGSFADNPVEKNTLDRLMQGVKIAAGTAEPIQGNRYISLNTAELITDKIAQETDCFGWYTDQEAACAMCMVKRQCRTYQREMIIPMLGETLDEKSMPVVALM